MTAPDTTASGATSFAHTCLRCGAAAPWGFNTRRGLLWFCADHKAEGLDQLEAPVFRRPTAND